MNSGPKNFGDIMTCNGVESMQIRPYLDHVAHIFKAMGDTSRLLILRELKSSPCKVGELVTKLDTSQANISKHLKILHQAGLLDREKRGNQVIYSINDPMVMEMCALVCDKLNRDMNGNGRIQL